MKLDQLCLPFRQLYVRGGVGQAGSAADKPFIVKIDDDKEERDNSSGDEIIREMHIFSRKLVSTRR